MMAASIPDGEAIVDLLLQRGADVNLKSKSFRAIKLLSRAKG